MKRIFLLLLVAVCLQTALYAWQQPKRDVRSVWLTTAWGLDWPAVRVPAPVNEEGEIIFGNLNEGENLGVVIANEAVRETARNQQKTQLLNILNRLADANFNTIYFQVRPMNDAFYRSSFASEPWSQFLSSVRGADPGWSPLGFLIEHAHARGIEVHAWLNPYRYSSAAGNHGTLATDLAVTHPHWLLDYGLRADNVTHIRILNPGMPEVRQYIADIIEDIIRNYNVDGIVLDDYFYVSGTTNAMDQLQFENYNPRGLSRVDWRIDNINQMVRDVQARINKVRPEVAWGISPAGVAIGTNHFTIARDLYGIRPCPSGQDWQRASLSASPVAWLYEGIIDYISPQIYWSTTPSGNNFRLINDWWAEISNHFGRHHFASTTSHNGGSTANAAFSTPEVLYQIQLTRDADRNSTGGTVHFRFGSYLPSVYDAMAETPFEFPALTAIYGWKPAPLQGLVTNLNVSGQNVTWDYTRVGIPYVRYAIYAVPNDNRNNAGVFTSPRYLQGVSYTTSFTLRDGISASTHRIAVAVYDRFGNLFPPRVFGESETTIAPAVLTFPADGQANVPVPAPHIPQTLQTSHVPRATSIFTWEATGADFYVWQIAEDRDFERPIASRETRTPSFSLALQTNIRPNITYYWRVKSIKANAPVSISQVRSFTGTSTPEFGITAPNIRTNISNITATAPTRGAFNQSLTPTISWTNLNLGAGMSYTLELSTYINFDEILYSANTSATSHTIPSGVLELSNTYYVRVRVQYDGRPLVTEFHYFSTSLAPLEPFPVPTIVSPVDGATIYGTEIDVIWKEQRSRGFSIELSQNSNFPSRQTQTVGTRPFVFNTTYSNVAEGTWYIRMRAMTDDMGRTAFSSTVTVQVVAEPPVSLPEIDESKFFAWAYRVSDGVSNLVINQVENKLVSVEIFSLTGNLLSKQTHGLGAGTHTLTLDMINYARGVYLVRINAGNNTKTLKVHR